MSLTKISLLSTVKKQYRYKLKAYVQVFMTLVFLQLLAILFTLNGVGMAGSSSEWVEVDVHYYSADIVVFFTMMWGFITAILITTKAYRNDDFVFITNRLSSNLSNLLFLLTASIIGGLTALLSTYLIKVIVYFFVGQLTIDSTNVVSAPVELLLGIVAATFYIILFSALGYFVGTLVQIHKAFVVLVPALFFGSLFLGAVSGYEKTVTNILGFIFTEPSILLFIFKIIVVAGMLFSGAFVISNRLEVKQ
ncbi:hypothetical protein [Neobacillus drentensis]|uniref:hypothetical protein n=1 Tax=Neobacillus drentensis TaxID=220684 RepID=UPI0008265FF1|nr:hypothetical protein [Neobacillus drentensis]